MDLLWSNRDRCPSNGANERPDDSKGKVSMDPKITAKDRATSTQRASEPAPATPPTKARANAAAKASPAPAAPKAKSIFGTTKQGDPLCHHRDSDGKPDCKFRRDPQRPRTLLCSEPGTAQHEQAWHRGEMRLTATGMSRLLALREAAKLDPTTAKQPKAAKPKSAGTSKAVVGKKATAAQKGALAKLAPKTRPAPVATIPPQNTAPKLPEATVAKVE